MIRAVQRLFDQQEVDAASIEEFLAGREVPIVEGRSVTFLYSSV